MQVVGETHTPAASLLEKRPPVPIEQDVCSDSRAGLDVSENRKSSFPHGNHTLVGPATWERNIPTLLISVRMINIAKRIQLMHNL
jgi:hypothetical protein